MKKVVLFLGCVSLLFSGEFYYINGGKKVELIPKEDFTRSSKNILYFEKRDGKEIAITNRLFLKLKSDKTIDNYLNSFNLKIVKEYPNHTYLLKAKSAKLAMDIANELSSKSDVIFAQPDLMKKWSLR